MNKPGYRKAIRLLWIMVGQVFWLLTWNSAEIEFLHSGYLVINDIITSGWNISSIMLVLLSLTESFKLPEYQLESKTVVNFRPNGHISDKASSAPLRKIMRAYRSKNITFIMLQQIWRSQRILFTITICDKNLIICFWWGKILNFKYQFQDTGICLWAKY